MKKKKIIIMIAASVIIIGAAVFGVIYHNRYSLKKDTVTIELGDSLSNSASEYINARKKAVDGTTIDFSDVDFDKIGEYEAVASYGKKQKKFKVVVEDTTAPSIKKKESLPSVIVGKEVLLTDLIESVSDKGQIVSVTLKDSSDKEITSGKGVSELKFTPDTVGKVTYKVVVIDESKNESSEDLELNVSKDYESMVSGFHDFSITEGDSIDYMEGISKTSDEVTIEVDSSGVNTGAEGNYTVKYTLKGDDGVTTFEKTTNVEVKTKPVEKKSSSSGNNGASANSSENSSGGASSGGGNDRPGKSAYPEFGDPDFHSYWDGHTVAEYKSATGLNLITGLDYGFFAYPDNYIIGSYATIHLANGDVFQGSY